jgi:hypothetical protein
MTGATSLSLARISHTNRRIGPPNQRKLLCRNDFTQVRGAPDADRVYCSAATTRSNALKIRGDLSSRPNPASRASLDERAEPFHAIVLTEIGTPSAVAGNELFARLRPPCAKAEVAPKLSRRAPDLTVNQDVSRWRRLLRRELEALQQPFKVVDPQGRCLVSAVAGRDGPSR